MKDSLFEMELNEREKSFDFLKLVRRLLSYWPWFLVSLAIALVIGFLYLKYATVTYASVAKIKVIDDSKETDIAKDPMSIVWSDSKINMDNEIAVLKSFRLLSQVVDSLNLNVVHYEVGTIRTSEVWNGPFEITNVIANDSIERPLAFYVELQVSGFQITDENDVVYQIPYFQNIGAESVLPFNINLSEGVVTNGYKDRKFLIMLYPFQQAVSDLTNNLFIQTLNKKSEVLELWLFGENPTKSETILNTIIHEFNQDGITDRQQVSKRTLEFIDERFGYLTAELDSIEGGKQDFKRENNLSYIETDAESSLMRKSRTEEEVANLQTQISLASVLKQTVLNQSEYALLPVNIGLENVGLNASVSNYNEMALERERLMESVGESHPTLVTLSGQLERAKLNIIKTVNVYQAQLRTSLGRLNQEKNSASSMFSSLPEKEKMLRSIERQQSIKENLFLLLLQKREEAAINLAVTAPSIKVVDYGLTDSKPIAPKRMVVMGIAGMIGLLLPLAVFYIRYATDATVQERSDLLVDKFASIPILAELPHLKHNKLFKDVNDRSVLAESFRILATNIDYALAPISSTKGQVIFVTSSITGEGKSLTAYNLSVAYASMNKSVLLVGADFRNPEVHEYFGLGIKAKGLTSYLEDPSKNWEDFINPGLPNNPLHHVLLTGPIPSNTPQLLSGKAFGQFITKAQEAYEVVIVDTAPVVPVTDTLLISKYADLTLYMVRSGVTPKKLLDVTKDLQRTNKLHHMTFVLNDVQATSSKTYKYGYGYS